MDKSPLYSLKQYIAFEFKWSNMLSNVKKEKKKKMGAFRYIIFKIFLKCLFHIKHSQIIFSLTSFLIGCQEPLNKKIQN